MVFNYDYAGSSIRLLAALSFAGIMIIILPIVDLPLLNHGKYHEIPNVISVSSEKLTKRCGCGL
jgi:hypothetical protein